MIENWSVPINIEGIMWSSPAKNMIRKSALAQNLVPSKQISWCLSVCVKRSSTKFMGCSLQIFQLGSCRNVVKWQFLGSFSIRKLISLQKTGNLLKMSESESKDILLSLLNKCPWTWGKKLEGILRFNMCSRCLPSLIWIAMKRPLVHVWHVTLQIGKLYSQCGRHSSIW